MKQTEARNGRKKIAQGKRCENERRPGFNKQNKILPLLSKRGEGRGEESKNPGACRTAAHGVISSRQSMSPELLNELPKLRNEAHAHGMQKPGHIRIGEAPRKTRIDRSHMGVGVNRNRKLPALTIWKAGQVCELWT
jgi:hypothetical protein